MAKMRVVDLNKKVTAQYYDNEYKEWSLKTITIGDLLWDSIDENVDDISFDAQEIRHGKWIVYNRLADNMLLDENEVYVCSACMEQKVKRNIYKYCPNCGARMDGEEK